MIATVLWKAQLQGKPWIAFCDNEGARHSLARGYSSDADHCALVAVFWSICAATHSRPWLERVESSANLADAISRFDLAEAEANWARPPLGSAITALWTVLIETIHRSAVTSLESIRQLVQSS